MHDSQKLLFPAVMELAGVQGVLPVEWIQMILTQQLLWDVC